MDNALPAVLSTTTRVPAASGTWPLNDNSGSIYLASFNADLTLGGPQLPGHGVSSYASPVAGAITIHPGDEIGTWGERIVGPAPLDVDFDDNGRVDSNDFLNWQHNLGRGGSNGTGDAHGNGMVNADDLAVSKASFGASTAAAAVAEPACAMLALLSGAALVAARR